MGWDIRIGNAVYDADCEESYIADEMADPNDQAAGCDNHAHWSASGFDAFLQSTGLEPLFMEQGLFAPYTCKPVTQQHLDAVRAALSPAVTDSDRWRLEWLAFWIDWALKHCEKPAIRWA